MKSIILATLLVAAATMCPTAAVAANKRANCRLDNSGGCVKMQTNGWLEFCPSYGDERIDSADGSDLDCISIKPFQFSEYSASNPSNRAVLLNSWDMNFQVVGSYARQIFTNDCTTDISVPCVDGADPIEAIRVTVAIDPSASSRVFLDLFIFSDAATLKFKGNKFDVEAGSFKFDIRSDSYTFTNAAMDSVAFDIELRTLSNAIGAHTITTSSDRTTVDTFMVSPNNYVSTDLTTAAQTYGAASVVKAQRASTYSSTKETTVVSFQLAQVPAGSKFRYDPFMSIPAGFGSRGNGAQQQQVMLSVCVIFMMIAALGML